VVPARVDPLLNIPDDTLDNCGVGGCVVVVVQVDLVDGDLGVAGNLDHFKVEIDVVVKAQDGRADVVDVVDLGGGGEHVVGDLFFDVLELHDRLAVVNLDASLAVRLDLRATVLVDKVLVKVAGDMAVKRGAFARVLFKVSEQADKRVLAEVDLVGALGQHKLDIVCHCLLFSFYSFSIVNIFIF